MGIDIRKKEVQEMFDIFDDPMDKYIQIIESSRIYFKILNSPFTINVSESVNTLYLLL